MSRRIAVIFGAGPGVGASVAAALAPTHSLLLLSRSLPGSLPKLGLSVGEDKVIACSSDGSQQSMEDAVQQMKSKWPEGVVDVGVYNMGGGFNPQRYVCFAI